MNFGELKSAVSLCLGNLRDGDPYYTKLGWAVNSAIREVPKRVLAVKGDYNQFFELKTSWRDITVDGTHEYGLPANCLIAFKLYSLDYDGVFLGEGVGSSREVQWSDYQEFELLQRDVEGLPRNWTMGGTNVKVWPTPDATHLTWFRVFGLKLEADITSDAASPTLREHWHNAVIFYAAYLLCGMKGWKERSQHFFAMFMESVGAAIDPTAVLLSHQDGRIDIIGDPTR
jgi:hypothetical protein